MNIPITNFLVAYPQFSFIKQALYKLTKINSIIPIYKNKNDYLLYIGKNEKRHLFLYGTYSKIVYNQLVIMFASWYSNVKFKDNNLYIYDTEYKPVSIQPNNYIIIAKDFI